MIDKYFKEIIINKKNKALSDERMKKAVEKSIENLNCYIYVIDKIFKESKIKNEAIEEFLCYFSFLFEDYVNDLIINNVQSLKIMQRTLLESFFKFMFIIKSDEYVSQLYSDFRFINIYNTFQLENDIQKLSKEEQEYLNKEYNKISKKYNLSSGYGSDIWIKIAMKHLNVKNPSKNITDLIDYLIKNEYINVLFASDYKDCCDFIHSNPNAMALTQCIYIEKDSFTYIDSAIKDFNFIIYNILSTLDEDLDFKITEYVNIAESNLYDLLVPKDEFE